VKRYGFQQGSTSQPRDRYDLGNDPGLKVLKDSYLKQQAQMGNFDPRGRHFSQLFFNSPAKVYEAERWPRDLNRLGMPGEERFWQASDEPFLYWKTADKVAYVPNIAQVKDEVEAKWRFARARELARKEAEDVAAKVVGGEKDAVSLLTQGSPHAQTLFTLDS